MDIIKRDGRKVPFDVSKIYIAIQSAVTEVEKQTGTPDKEDLAGKISTEICTEIMNDDKDVSVEEIQDLVEKKLMASDRKDVAKAYILYRNERTKIRSFNTSMMKDIIEKLYAKNVKNQNANIDENSFGGRVGEAADTMMKRIALESGIMSERAVYNHINNRIYTHDLGSYVIAMHNCLTLTIDTLFKFGVKTRQTAIRGAKSVSTAFQLLAVYFQLQSLNQFGGVSASHIDHSMVPYVRYSFKKQYILEYMKDRAAFGDLDIVSLYFDTYTDELGIVRNKFDDWLEDNKSSVLKELNLKDEDFRLDNKDKLDKKLYQAALFNVVIEVKQSVEAMYHNLNSLQSRSGKFYCPVL